MKKIIISVLALGFLFSCGDLDELNDNPKKAADAPAGTLFANAQKNLVDILTSANVNRGIWRLLAQQWAETTYNDESVYDIATRNIPQNVWGILYRDVLKDLETSRTNVLAIDPLFIDETVRQNQIQMIEIMEVYAWTVVVNIYGPIPYSSPTYSGGQALDIENPSPKYEKAEDIYKDLLTRLDAAMIKLDADKDNFGDYDLLYKGDYDSWIKFGNSLKLKMGMILADVPAFNSKAIVEAAAPHVFTSNDDNALIKYKDTPPNTNPVWVDLIQSGRHDFVAANTIIDAVVALEDPRTPVWFTQVDTSSEEGVEKLAYWGGIYGNKNSYSKFSHPGDAIIDPTQAGVFMDYTEVEFYLAEAVERGYNVGGDAETHYNNAITSSMNYWGVDQADIDTYLDRPDVAYATADGNYKEKIGTQKWIAMYNRGYEAWTEWRRLDYPVLVAPDLALTDIPLRYPYPVNEQTLNTANYEGALTLLPGGVDKVSTRIFWDVPQ